MAFLDRIKERAKAEKKTIVLPESMDRRTWEAAEKVLKEDIADIIIIGTPEEVEANSKGLDVSKATIINPFTYEKTEEYIGKKVTLEGWIKNHRKQKEFGFIDFNDGTFFKSVQVVYDNNLSTFEEIQRCIRERIFGYGTLQREIGCKSRTCAGPHYAVGQRNIHQTFCKSKNCKKRRQSFLLYFG